MYTKNLMRCAALAVVLLITFCSTVRGQQQAEEKSAPRTEKPAYAGFQFIHQRTWEPPRVVTVGDRTTPLVKPLATPWSYRVESNKLGRLVLETQTSGPSPEQQGAMEQKKLKLLLDIGEIELPFNTGKWRVRATVGTKVGPPQSIMGPGGRCFCIKVVLTKKQEP